jgi:uncharacterized membrane protein
MGREMADTQMSSARLEAFSAGVIAVIITPMVLELHVPDENGWAGLWSVAPRLSVYLLSFFMLGSYWIHHDELIGRTEDIDYRVLSTNLIVLFVLSLVPSLSSISMRRISRLSRRCCMSWQCWPRFFCCGGL